MLSFNSANVLPLSGSRNLISSNLHLLSLCLNRWTYSDPSWARIAKLLPSVVSCAEAGDEIANKILHDSVLELTSSVKAVVQRLELCGEGTLNCGCSPSSLGSYPKFILSEFCLETTEWKRKELVTK